MWFYLNKELFPSNVALSTCIMYASEFPWEYHMAWGWWGGGFPDSPPSPYIHHSLLSFLPLGSFSIGFWISTSIPKLMYFPSFLFDMGVSWGGVTLTLLASAGMKKKKEKVKQSLLFLRRDETPSFLMSRGEPPLKRKTAHAVSASVSLWHGLVKVNISIKRLFSGTG